MKVAGTIGGRRRSKSQLPSAIPAVIWISTSQATQNTPNKLMSIHTKKLPHTTPVSFWFYVLLRKKAVYCEYPNRFGEDTKNLDSEEFLFFFEFQIFLQEKLTCKTIEK
jgi:hypothetical protein